MHTSDKKLYVFSSAARRVMRVVVGQSGWLLLVQEAAAVAISAAWRALPTHAALVRRTNTAPTTGGKGFVN